MPQDSKRDLLWTPSDSHFGAWEVGGVPIPRRHLLQAFWQPSQQCQDGGFLNVPTGRSTPGDGPVHTRSRAAPLRGPMPPPRCPDLLPGARCPHNARPPDASAHACPALPSVQPTRPDLPPVPQRPRDSKCPGPLRTEHWPRPPVPHHRAEGPEEKGGAEGGDQARAASAGHTARQPHPRRSTAPGPAPARPAHERPAHRRAPPLESRPPPSPAPEEPAHQEAPPTKKPRPVPFGGSRCGQRMRSSPEWSQVPSPELMVKKAASYRDHGRNADGERAD